jgi:hypothetical protein
MGNRKNFSKHHARAVLPGQAWIRPMGQATSRPWEAEWRVMAVAEGYAMGRFKGAAPSIARIQEMEDWRLAQGKGANDGK